MRRLRVILGVVLVTLIAGGAVLAYVLIMRASQAQSATAPDPSGGASARVAILVRSAATAAYFAALPGATADGYARTIDGWQVWLARAGYRVVVIDPDRLARSESADDADVRDVRELLAEWTPGAPPVIVAPSYAAVADDALAVLLGALKRGAGLVATHAFALHDAAGAWRGYEPLRQLVGARPIDATGPLRFVALHGESPLAAGLPAGARLELQPYDAPLHITTDDAAASWVRWELLPVNGDGSELAAIAAGRYGRGRVVWLDFEPSALVAGATGGDWMEQLTRNAMAWVGQHPIAALERWPGGARIAALIGLDAEYRFEEAAVAARACRDAGLPLTSFAVSMLAEKDPATVRSLAAAGEVASHTHDHLALAGLDLETQRTQLARSRTILNGLTGKPVTGFRPPEESTDDQTLVALAATGYEYVAGLANKDRAEPWMEEGGGRPLVVLPRVPLDDYEFVVRNPLADGESVIAAMTRDLEHVRRLGGLYYFSFHSQYVDDPRIGAALPQLTALARASDVWVATGSAIATWWRTRAAASIAVKDDPPGVRIELDAGAAADRLVVIVDLPDELIDVRVESEVGAAPSVAQAGDRPLRLEYRDLRAGERRVTRLVRG